MVKLTLIFISILCFYSLYSYPANSCKDSFSRMDKLTVKELRQLDPKHIQRLPVNEIQKITSQQLELFSSEQMKVLPVKELLISQAVSLKDGVDIIIKDTQLQETAPEVFSILVRTNIQFISPGNISLISTKQIRMWENNDIRKLTAPQIQAFNPEQIIAFGKLVEHFLPKQIQYYGENIRYFLPEQLELFSYKQSSALTVGQVAVLSKDQLHSLQYYLYL